MTTRWGGLVLALCAAGCAGEGGIDDAPPSIERILVERDDVSLENASAEHFEIAFGADGAVDRHGARPDGGRGASHGEVSADVWGDLVARVEAIALLDAPRDGGDIVVDGESVAVWVARDDHTEVSGRWVELPDDVAAFVAHVEALDAEIEWTPGERLPDGFERDDTVTALTVTRYRDDFPSGDADWLRLERDGAARRRLHGDAVMAGDDAKGTAAVVCADAESIAALAQGGSYGTPWGCFVRTSAVRVERADGREHVVHFSEGDAPAAVRELVERVDALGDSLAWRPADG